MHNKVVYRLARGLRRSGLVVLRFNFRGVGRSQGEHGHLEGEIEDTRAALDWLRARYPVLPFALAGFSFGARAITRLGCSLEGASFLVAAGFPTRHGPSDYLETCAAPKVFVQSTNDQYGPRAELERDFARFAPPKKTQQFGSAFLPAGTYEHVILAANAYKDSLARLRSFSLKALYPGHGRVSTTPIEDIDQAIANAQMLLETKNNENIEIFYQNAHENIDGMGRNATVSN